VNRVPSLEEVAEAVARQLGEARLGHVRRVAATAVHLAERFALPVREAALAGWLHDFYRETPEAELRRLARHCGVEGAESAPVGVLHGPVAARLLPRRWPDLPTEVLQAIDRHTTGDVGMSRLDCLLYVSDLIEPGRSFAGLDAVRQAAEQDLEKATLLAMDLVLQDLLARHRPIDVRAVRARNDLLQRLAPH